MGIPIMSHLATSTILSDKRTYPGLFRVLPTDAQYTQMLAQLFNGWGFRSVGLLKSNDAFGIGFRRALEEACLAKDIVVKSMTFDASADLDVYEGNVLRTLKHLVDQRLNVIVYAGGTTAMDWVMAKASHELDWLKGKLYIGRRNNFGASLASARNRSMVVDFLRGSLQVTVGHNPDNVNWIALRKQWPTFSVDEVNLQLPNSTTSSGTSYQLSPDFFNCTSDRTWKRFERMPMRMTPSWPLG
jgi:hypothetical protein